MRLKPKQGRLSDTRYELAILSKETSTALEEVARDFWRLMQRNEENIEDSKEREVATINYLASTLYSLD